MEEVVKRWKTRELKGLEVSVTVGALKGQEVSVEKKEVNAVGMKAACCVHCTPLERLLVCKPWQKIKVSQQQNEVREETHGRDREP